MKTVGSLDAQEAKIRAMATLQGAELIDVIVDGGESAKSLNRPGVQRLLSLVNGGNVDAVIIAKLDRLTRSVKDLGRLVIAILGAVSQWECEAIGERKRGLPIANIQMRNE